MLFFHLLISRSKSWHIHARTHRHGRPFIHQPARPPAINKKKWEIWDTVLMGQNLPQKNNDLVAQTSIKFKSQLNFKCKLICWPLQVILSVILHLSLIKVCATQSRLLRTVKAATFFFIFFNKSWDNTPWMKLKNGEI